MIYFIIFIFLACFTIFDLVTMPGSVRFVAIAAIFFSLVIIAGIRWDTGPDWDSYYFFFTDYEKYRDGIYINMLEPGYTMLNGFVKTFTDNYTYFLLFIALLTIGLKFYVFLKHKGIILLLIFFYYCYYMADIASVRQFTALSITLLASVYIVKKKPFIFTLLVVLAITIHASSIAFLGAYWLYHKKMSNKLLISALVVGFILGFLNISGLILEKAIGLLGPASIYADKLLKYSSSGIGDGTGNTNPYVAFIMGGLKRAIILPILFYYKTSVTEVYRDQYRGYLNLLVVGNVVYFLFIISFPEITRLSVSYLYFEIFLLSMAAISIKDIKLKFAFVFVLILFGGFRLYTFMAPYIDLYVPYKTFFTSI